MGAPGKLAEILTARDILYVGLTPISHGTSAPAAADAYGNADAVYIRTGTGSASTMVYLTADTGVTWRVVDVTA